MKMFYYNLLLFMPLLLMYKIKDHVLMLLIVLENLGILLFLFLFLYSMSTNMTFYLLYYLIILVSDAVVGLCCLVSLIRSSYLNKVTLTLL